MENKVIYLDNAATTAVDNKVTDVISGALKNDFYNISSVYKNAIVDKNLVEKSREYFLKALNAEGGNLIFTGSATEANNTALLKIKNRANFVALIGSTEHPAIFEMTEKLRKQGCNILYIPVDSYGKVIEEEYIKLLQNNPVKFVSVMHVNNENGMINNIERLCYLAKQKDKTIIFHCDGVQAFGKIDVDLEKLGVDMYTICSHKINGPKGIGALYFKKNVNLEPLILGGGQEMGLRSGTENLPYILGFETAAKLKMQSLAVNFERVKKLNNEFLTALKTRNIEFENYSNEECSPYILQLRIIGVRGEVLLHALEEDGIYISTGSACSSKKKVNRGLEARGISYEKSQQVVRISFAPVDVDINYVANCFEKRIKELKN